MDASLITRQDKADYDRWWLHAHLFGLEAADRQHGERKAAAQQRVLDRVSGREGRVVQLPRVTCSIEEFKRDYLAKGLPVVLAGAAREWACVKTWNPQFLADKYGDDRVTLIDASPTDMNAINREPETTTLREVILSMDDGPMQKYSRFNRILHDHPELIGDFDYQWLLKGRNLFCSGKTFQVFIGGKGTKTHLHCAPEHNLFTQVYGRKHWLIYPPSYDVVLNPAVARTPYFHTNFNPDAPDYEQFPAMRHLDTYECVLEPGDVLFNPPSWWHHVSNWTGSIGVGFRWFAPQDAFKIDFMQALLMVLATNPPIWVATANRTDFAKIFTYQSRRQYRERERPAVGADRAGR